MNIFLLKLQQIRHFEGADTPKPPWLRACQYNIVALQMII